MIDHEIDGIIDALIAGRDVERNTLALRRLEVEAVPRLLHHLASANATARGLSLFALQHVWSPAALERVAEVLGDPDLEFRRMAAVVIDRHEGRAMVAKLCERFIGHPDPSVAGFAFEHCELMFPDVERAVRALDRDALRPRICKYIARYHSDRLTVATRRLTDHPDPDLRRAAIVGLINQNDTAGSTREGIRDALSGSIPDHREMAAEYLAWHGDSGDLPALGAGLLRETDAYAAASIRDALRAIERRENEGSRAATLGPNVHGGDTPYRGALESLSRDHPRDEAFDQYARAEELEPRWFFEGQLPSDEWRAVRVARFEAQARLFAFPWTPAEESPVDASVPAVADTVMPPVRDYLNREERNFGVHTEATNRAFKSVVHVGDDVAWYRDHRSVVAIADGIVKKILREPTWGHLLVIEHTLARGVSPVPETIVKRFADGRVERVLADRDGLILCSLYAHLGPFIRVRPGDRVSAGQKIGTVGRALTLENGGYPAHLHFGLHLGPYWQRPRRGSLVDVRFEGKHYRGCVMDADYETTEATIRRQGNPCYPVRKSSRWECGYIARWYWNSGRHGWMDPVEFLSSSRRVPRDD